MFNSTPKTQEELKKLIEADPPMYVTGNKLILNKLIFKELKVNQIQSLQKLGPTSAIKILQKFIIGYFKERIKKTSSASSGSGSGGSGAGSSKDMSTQKSNGIQSSSQLHPDHRHSTDPQLSCPNLNPTSSPLITSNPTSSSSSSSDTTTTHPSSSLLKRKTCHFSTPSTSTATSTTRTPDSKLINPDFFNADSLSPLVNPDLTSNPNPNSTGDIHSKKIKLNPG
ncbi:hypothetical protein Pst134EA_021064 [Puccinia striiformis f. sp. tritici]|uniref:hypothetical protein n=1 Tax=Puccinia striiformis f. sp. tritici TaxID=168172 RepID=UPI002007F8ED|nr:hypothetical protein Pst134EA_021064 [Puccinia striiformis f. sp. tritici]KAH9457177.1 hypothetical protein Pst134EA_021064 [Puccinia striiformis f. sp. tritici]